MAEEQKRSKIEKELMDLLRKNPEIMKFFVEHPEYIKEIVKNYEEKKEKIMNGDFSGGMFDKDKDIIARMAEEI